VNFPAALRSDRGYFLGVAVVFAVAPLAVLGSSFYQGILSKILIFALFGVALNLVFGHTDQLFLFLGGLGGIGAYSTALLADSIGVSAWLMLPVAMVVCGGLAAFVSWVAAKRQLTVILIAILTLNLQLVLSQVFVGARDFTGGSTGFSYDFFSLNVIGDAVGLPESVVIYYVALVALLGALAVYYRFINSKYGLAFEAIRDDEVAAESIGIDVVRYKTVAGFTAGAIIAVAGTLLAREAAYITPSSFTFIAVDVLTLIILIVGGLRRMYGPVVGAVIVEAIEALLAANASEWRTALFGILLIVLFLYFRDGVTVALKDLFVRVQTSRGGGDGSAGSTDR